MSVFLRLDAEKFCPGEIKEKFFRNFFPRQKIRRLFVQKTQPRKGIISSLFHFAVDRMLVALLDSGSREVVYTACGVLINLMVDDDKRHVLKAEGGIAK